jgi:hypothetical protein
LQTEASAGDFDLVIMGNTNNQEPIYGTRNFYTDETEYFNAQNLNQKERRLRGDERSMMSKLPFVNFTEVSEVINDFYKEKPKPIEIFPRWLA